MFSSSYSFLVLILVQESNVASDSKTTLSSMNCKGDGAAAAGAAMAAPLLGQFFFSTSW